MHGTRPLNPSYRSRRRWNPRRGTVRTMGHFDATMDDDDFELTSKSKAHKKIKIQKDVYGGDIFHPEWVLSKSFKKDNMSHVMRKWSFTRVFFIKMFIFLFSEGTLLVPHRWNRRGLKVCTLSVSQSVSQSVRPSVCLSVRHTHFPDFSQLCFHISEWKLVASFHMKSYR